MYVVFVERVSFYCQSNHDTHITRKSIPTIEIQVKRNVDDEVLEERILNFSRIHHLTLRIMKSIGPKIREVAEEKVNQFITLRRTTKAWCPNLGTLLFYSLFSSKTWQGSVTLRRMFIMEWLDRNSFWLLRNPKCNHLSVLESDDDIAMSASRIIDSFVAHKTSIRLILFQNYFARTIAQRNDTEEEDLLNMYDESNGRPTVSMWQGLREETYNILNKVHTYQDFLRKIDLECLLDDGKCTSPDDFVKVLRNAMRRAKTKKYLKHVTLFSGSKVCPDDEEVSEERKTLIHTWDNLKDVAKIYRVRIEKKKKIFRRVVANHRKKMKKAERERKRKNSGKDVRSSTEHYSGGNSSSSSSSTNGTSSWRSSSKRSDGRGKEGSWRRNTGAHYE